MSRPSRLLVLFCALSLGAAHAAPKDDLRNIRVGMPIKALSTDGYTNITCAAKSGPSLPNWANFAKCAKDADGFHDVRFGYGDEPLLSEISDDGQGTKIAGQPVVLTLLIDDSGILQGLKAETDPAVRLFIKRRAHVFGLQAMARYGDEGWQCTDAKPTEHEQPLGNTFVSQHCEKTTADRHYIVNRALYHDPDRPLAAFTSKADLEIFAR